MQVDAEVYFWKHEKLIPNPLIRNNKFLQQQYLPEQILQNLHRNNMEGCLAFPSGQSELESRFLAELALTHPIIFGTIGNIDLGDVKAPEKIEAFHHYRSIRGYHLETNGDYKIYGQVMPLLKQYQYCLDLLLTPETNISTLNSWISSYPDQYFILKDCGSPDAKQPPLNSWETSIRVLSKNKNLSCKVSGLFTLGNWKTWRPADFYPFLEILFDAFGAERLLYASDWPFLLLSGIYVQWKSLLEKFTEKYTSEERDLFFGENARRIYQL